MTMQTYGQEATEQDYLTSGVFKDKGDRGKLHAFFSPGIVPAGLTDEEVRTCLSLYPRKDRLSKLLSDRRERERRAKYRECFEADYLALESYRETFSRLFGEAAFRMSIDQLCMLLSNADMLMHDPLPLPADLRTCPMTRECFAQGVAALLARMDELERKALT